MRSLHSGSTPSSEPVEKEGETDHQQRNTSTIPESSFTCASDQIPVRLDVDFSARVPVAEAAPRHGWHGVALVVHPLELGDLRVEKRCPGRVTDSRGSERSTLDPRLRGEIELQI
jgi:hypothetical protein